MAVSETSVSIALFLILNLLFFSTVSSTDVKVCSEDTSCPHPPKPKPVPVPPVSPPPHPDPVTCATDVLRLAVCKTLLNELKNGSVPAPLSTPCCSVLEPMVDMEAAICLCTAIKANILGVIFDWQTSFTMILGACGKVVSYTCK
ncbi:Hydrophobic seed protein domain [Dillenia turbinata]|uniref:Hydrophobic seed protein domain n=1 Tax=Dillenia turbinata TaxID=194707 RepID=A0AAN8Z4N7_9MAGN